MSYFLSQVNQMSQAEFTEAFGEIWENTPTIATKAWEQGPFEDIETLHQCMVDIVEGMSEAEQLKLIRAHPDLGSRAKMAQASVEEQQGAGLDRLSASQYEQLQRFNQDYKDKFGFPFVIAVKNHTIDSILDAFKTRLQNTPTQEKQQALAEIAKIARLRLESSIIDELDLDTVES